MKKLFFIFLILMFWLFSQNVFWDDKCDNILEKQSKPSDKCTVEWWPSDDMSNYISDLDSIFWEIKSSINSSTCDKDWGAIADLKQLKSIVTNTNQILDFWSFLSSWEFYLTPLYKWEVVQPIFRDNKLLEKQQEKINNIERQASSACALETKITWTKIQELWTLYWLKQLDTVWNVLIELRNLNNKVINYYRCVINDETDINCEFDSIFDSSNGLDKLKSSILSEYATCKTRWISWDFFSCKITKVIESGIWFEKWIKEWEKAIVLLRWAFWAATDKSKKLEKELLAKELQRQWISAKAAAIILQNLEDSYKEDWCPDSWVECFVKNIWKSVNWIVNNVKEIINEISNEIFPKDQPSSWWETKMPSTISSEFSKLFDKDKINKEIIEDYIFLKWLQTQSNVNLDKNIWILLEINYELADLNANIFNKWIESIEKTCSNYQAKGGWNCSF